MTLGVVLAQRGGRVERRRRARGNPAGQNRDDDEQERHRRERQRIEWFDADENATSGNSVVLWLDDAREVDDNHDDMAIRITATPIPLPASVLMLFAALGGLGVLSRKRSATVWRIVPAIQ